MSSATLSSSLEDYLEAIYGIVQQKHVARAKDIAQKLDVKGSSVTGALRSLARENLINYAPYDLITLTAEGEKIATDVFQRHTVLREFFTRVLGVDAATAEESACGMEHAVSAVILERLTKFVKFIENCPQASSKWIDGFGYFCENPDTSEDCEHCTSRSRK